MRSIVLVCNDASDVQELLRITFGYVGTMGKSWFFIDILTLQTTFCGHKGTYLEGDCPFFFSSPPPLYDIKIRCENGDFLEAD